MSDPIARRLGALALTATGAHEGPLREAIHRLKYGDEPGLAADLGALVGRCIAADLATGVRLDALVPDLDYSVAVLLHGIVEHGTYHGGQIVLLKRALGA